MLASTDLYYIKYLFLEITGVLFKTASIFHLPNFRKITDTFFSTFDANNFFALPA